MPPNKHYTVHYPRLPHQVAELLMPTLTPLKLSLEVLFI